MAAYPADGTTPWGALLKTYIDEPDAAVADSVAALQGTVGDVADTAARGVRPRAVVSERRVRGPVTVAPDLPTITYSVTPDAGIYNQAYVHTGATWPVDTGPSGKQVVNGFPYSVPLFQTRPHRWMMDGDKVCLYTITDGTALTERGFLLYVNGAPVNTAVQSFPGGATFTTIVFPDARPRLIELHTTARLSNVYCSKPYRAWKPARPTTPKVMLMGDSYAAGVTLEGAAVQQPVIHGFAQQLGAHIGCEATYWTDGIGGTGYLQPAAGGGPYSTRIATHYPLAPDVVVMWGGGANDLYDNRFTVAQIIAAATTLFTDMRSNLPDAKLVFCEGVTPPLGFASFADEYTAIRTALQAALADVGVYYIDVATTAPWLDGTGYVTATNATGNSDVYVGMDGIHPTSVGHRYLSERVAPRLRKVLDDQGSLVNTLI